MMRVVDEVAGRVAQGELHEQRRSTCTTSVTLSRTTNHLVSPPMRWNVALHRAVAAVGDVAGGGHMLGGGGGG